tara:strand:- start:853 stop:1296 length:444 start_codon:yes stop_codon:yes gene_type:complete
MKIIYNILSENENKEIVNSIVKKHPELLIKNCHISLSEEFAYLDSLPKSHLVDIKSQICRYVIGTNSNDKLNEYAGTNWHKDGDTDEVSVLLYLNGDNNKGGEFELKDNLIPFQINSMFVLNSAIDHRVRPYLGKNTRIALKWRFKL